MPTSTPSTQPPPAPATVPAPRLSSPLQALEQEEYGTDASASSFSSASKQEDPTESGEQVPPPNLPFRELVQKVREFLPIPDPAAEEDYKLGSALGRDPLLLQQEKWDRPPCIKLPMVPLPADCSGRFGKTKYVIFSGDRKISGHSTTQGKLVQCSGQQIFTDTTGGSPGIL